MGFVYLVRTYGKNISRLKIGQSSRGLKRINDYYTYNPDVELLYLVDCGKDYKQAEESLHEYFEEYRYKDLKGKEFFKDCDEIIDMFKNFNLSSILPGTYKAETDDGIKELLKGEHSKSVVEFFDIYFQLKTQRGRARYYRSYLEGHLGWKNVCEKITNLIPYKIYKLSKRWNLFL